MNVYLIFAGTGFCFFVLGVLLYLWSEDRSMRKEFQMIGVLRGEVCSLQKELATKGATVSFLMNERNKAHLENKCLKEEVEKLHDSGAANISLIREVSIRQDAASNQKPVLPTSIEIVFVDKTKQPVSKSKPKERGNNETPKQTPKKNRGEAPAKGKANLGRSYSDVERSNSGRVPPSRKRDKSVDL